MKHIFIFNPAAGDGTALETLKAGLTGREHCEIYQTRGPRDATEYIRARCKDRPEEDACYVACGGDGTINEVASGVAGQAHASMTVYACGSGNDFVKIMGGKDHYLNIDALITAKARPIDLLKVNERWCVNVFNFGFDTCVARTMAEVKSKPILGGKNAYTTGVAKALLTAMRNQCSVKVDGEYIHKGDMLLCTVANGQYVGGAFRCAPRAEVDDGQIEVCLVKPLSRIQFVQLIGPYKLGRHLEDPKFKPVIAYRRGAVVEVEAPEGFSASLDGEIVAGTFFRIEMCPGALRFAAPEFEN
jgi:diacylglycerol kinase (ATP)